LLIRCKNYIIYDFIKTDVLRNTARRWNVQRGSWQRW